MDDDDDNDNDDDDIITLEISSWRRSEDSLLLATRLSLALFPTSVFGFGDWSRTGTPADTSAR